MATMHMLHHFGLDKNFKLYIKPAFSRLLNRPYEHDVKMSTEFNGTSDIHAQNTRDATYVMKSVLEQDGLQQGGFILGGRVRRESTEPRDLFNGHIMAMDTFARALRNAVRMISDGAFSRSFEQRYASYKSG